MRLLVMSMAVMGLLMSECTPGYPQSQSSQQRYYDCLRGSLLSDCVAEFPTPSTPQQQFLQDRYDCLREATRTQRYSLKPIVVPPSNNSNARDPAPSERDPLTWEAASVRQHYEAQLYRSCMAARGHQLMQ
jgi:hypothetical protein